MFPLYLTMYTYSTKITVYVSESCYHGHVIVQADYRNTLFHFAHFKCMFTIDLQQNLYKPSNCTVPKCYGLYEQGNPRRKVTSQWEIWMTTRPSKVELFRLRKRKVDEYDTKVWQRIKKLQLSRKLSLCPTSVSILFITFFKCHNFFLWKLPILKEV